MIEVEFEMTPLQNSRKCIIYTGESSEFEKAHVHKYSPTEENPD